MAKKDHGMPRVAFLGPARARVKHVLALFKINSRGEDGLPRECVLIRDDETVNVEQGGDFMTAYIPAVMTEKE